MLWGLFDPYCTLWFNRLGPFTWNHCCKSHDRGYSHYTLDYDRYGYRLMQDTELRRCVNKVLPGMGWVMFWGVRIFGAFVNMGGK